ncbi:unnamed protein product [Amoebophrya sp. A120]|nr:unnamed protein product [Amoebophrya sp. A120]|eukprot:GSA120T00014744001.1
MGATSTTSPLTSFLTSKFKPLLSFLLGFQLIICSTTRTHATTYARSPFWLSAPWLFFLPGDPHNLNLLAPVTAQEVEREILNPQEGELPLQQPQLEQITRCNAHHPNPYEDPNYQQIRELQIDWEQVRTPLAEFGTEILQAGGRNKLSGEGIKQLVNTLLWPTIVKFKCFLDVNVDQENVRQLTTEELLGVLSVRLAWLATNTEDNISNELAGAHWLVEWSLLIDLINWKLFFLYDFSRVIFPLLYVISDSIRIKHGAAPAEGISGRDGEQNEDSVLLQDPCSQGWENHFDLQLPQKLDDLDLDLHESWCHFLTEGVLQREHLNKCPVAMAWLALNLAFINVAAQDRVQAFEYVHQAQAFLTRVKYLKAYKKPGRGGSSGAEVDGAAIAIEAGDRDASSSPTTKSSGASSASLPAVPSSTASGSSGTDSKAGSRVQVEEDQQANATTAEPLLLFQNLNAQSQTEEENENLVAEIYERKITFPHDLDLRKFYGMQFPIWELLAKMDFFQGLSIQVQSDEENAKKHLDKEMQGLSSVVFDSGVADGRHAWMLENWSQFDIREVLGSSSSSSSDVGAAAGSVALSRTDSATSRSAAGGGSRTTSSAPPPPAAGSTASTTAGNSRVPDLQLLLQSHNFPKIQIVDVGAIQVRGKPHVYHRLLMQDLCQVIGFDPNEKYRKSYPNMLLFPHYVGDGSRRTFFVTQNGLSSSLLEPNVDVVSKYDQLEEAYKVVLEQSVPTVKLDYILRPNNYDIDFLKVDVQGAEMLVFQGAEESLEEVVVIDVEVHFQKLYKDMPLFADIDIFLRNRDFVFHRLSDLTGRGMKPTRLSSSSLWGNAIYIKDIDTQYRKLLQKAGHRSRGTADHDLVRVASADHTDAGINSAQENEEKEKAEGRQIAQAEAAPQHKHDPAGTEVEVNPMVDENEIFRLASKYNECVKLMTAERTSTRRRSFPPSETDADPPVDEVVDSGPAASATGAVACEKELRHAWRRRTTAIMGAEDGAPVVKKAGRESDVHLKEDERVQVELEASSSSATSEREIVELLKRRREKLIKQAIILHEIYAAMDVAMNSLSKVGKHSGLATKYYYKMVDSLPTEKYIPGKGTYELTQGFRPPEKALRKRARREEL